MQANEIHSKVGELAQGLVSLDSSEIAAAVNRYYETNSTFENPLMQIHGASRIKQLMQLQSHIPKERTLVGEPTFDEQSQTASFRFNSIWQLPTIPSYIPFAGYVSGRRMASLWDVKLHLNTSASTLSEDSVFMVTKTHVQMTQRPQLEGLLPMNLLRPIVTFFTLGVLNLANFFNVHSSATGKRGFATNLKENVEGRAKKSGIPIEQYKAQAYETVDGLRNRASYVTENVEVMGKEALAYVDKLTDQARDSEAAQNLHNKAQEIKPSAQEATQRVKQTPMETMHRDPDESILSTIDDVSRDTTLVDDRSTPPFGDRSLGAPYVLADPAMDEVLATPFAPGHNTALIYTETVMNDERPTTTYHGGPDAK